MVLDCTWSVEGGTGCYLVVMGRYRVVLVGTHGLNHQIIQYSEKEKVMTDKQKKTIRDGGSTALYVAGLHF